MVHMQVASKASIDPRPASWRFAETLLAVYLCCWAALAISPVSRSDWLLENLLVFVSIPLLLATRRAMPFSNASYACLFVFFSFHSVGAHYTYALVPYDRWFEQLTGGSVQSLLHLHRNHFDRFVHFLYGLLILLPSVEFLRRYASLQSAWRWLMPILFIASHSTIYEVIEWLAALVVAPELGEAYLGTQGDHWDAQQDMALAMLGAIVATAFLEMSQRLSRRSAR